MRTGSRINKRAERPVVERVWSGTEVDKNDYGCDMTTTRIMMILVDDGEWVASSR